MYILYRDNELIDIKHKCCLTHARAKFKYAYEQGCKSAYFFLYMVGKLYKLEEEYKRLKLLPQEIYKRRNDDTTAEIVESIRIKLYELLANGDEANNDFMQRTLNYLRTFWKQIFAYRNDGEYSYRQHDNRTGNKTDCSTAKGKHVLRKR